VNENLGSDTAEYATIDLAKREGIATITFTRPEQLNALSPAMLGDLLEAIGGLDLTSTNALVLRGTGRAFCAGVDIDSPYFMENVEGDTAFEGTRLLDEQHALIETIYALPVPTVAGINGLTVGGGGFGMAMACDMRIAVEGARFWLVPGQLSVVQDFALTWSLQRAIGQARTMELAFTGRRVTAREGETWGFLNRVVTDEVSLDEAISELVGPIGRQGPDSVRMLKHVIRSGAGNSLPEQLRWEAIANGLCFNSAEFARDKSEMLRRIRGQEG
jgi:enoyl-CoA hydratase/carnithine racemase